MALTILFCLQKIFIGVAFLAGKVWSFTRSFTPMERDETPREEVELQKMIILQPENAFLPPLPFWTKCRLEFYQIDPRAHALMQAKQCLEKHYRIWTLPTDAHSCFRAVLFGALNVCTTEHSSWPISSLKERLAQKTHELKDMLAQTNIPPLKAGTFVKTEDIDVLCKNLLPLFDKLQSSETHTYASERRFAWVTDKRHNGHFIRNLRRISSIYGMVMLFAAAGEEDADSISRGLQRGDYGPRVQSPLDYVIQLDNIEEAQPIHQGGELELQSLSCLMGLPIHVLNLQTWCQAMQSGDDLKKAHADSTSMFVPDQHIESSPLHLLQMGQHFDLIEPLVHEVLE